VAGSYPQRPPTHTRNPTVAPRVVAKPLAEDEATARAERRAEFHSDLEAYITRAVLDVCTAPASRARACRGCAVVGVPSRRRARRPVSARGVAKDRRRARRPAPRPRPAVTRRTQLAWFAILAVMLGRSVAIPDSLLGAALVLPSQWPGPRCERAVGARALLLRLLADALHQAELGHESVVKVGPNRSGCPRPTLAR
jgi:hypothetical protein